MNDTLGEWMCFLSWYMSYQIWYVQNMKKRGVIQLEIGIFKIRKKIHFCHNRVCLHYLIKLQNGLLIRCVIGSKTNKQFIFFSHSISYSWDEYLITTYILRSIMPFTKHLKNTWRNQSGWQYSKKYLQVIKKPYQMLTNELLSKWVDL